MLHKAFGGGKRDENRIEEGIAKYYVMLNKSIEEIF